MVLKTLDEFRLKDGASLNPGERVEVYFNIQKGGFSIVSRDSRNPNNGKVIAYSSHVLIKDATFHINENKLKNILIEKRKTVYAVVKGTFVSVDKMDDAGFRQGYCNPYKTGKFIDFASGEQIVKADYVYFYDKFFSFC